MALALGILGLVVWLVFLSPYSFSRFPLADQYRTFNAHQGGSYVVYLEFPGESRPSLPPALDVSASSLSGQRIQVRRVGQLGSVGAPDAYHVGRYEGRAIATVTVSGGGAFLLTIDHRPVSTADADQELPVTEGTIAVGRAWGRGWATGLWFAAALFVVPMVIGIAPVGIEQASSSAPVASARWPICKPPSSPRGPIVTSWRSTTPTPIAPCSRRSPCWTGARPGWPRSRRTARSWCTNG